MDIVGEDIVGGAIQRLARELGLTDRVRFHGFMTQRELLPLMQAAQVLAVSSRHEAGPVAALEAAAVGVLSVGTAVGRVGEWAPEASLAVPVGDAQSLADALHRVLADKEFRLELARAAWRRAAGEHRPWCRAPLNRAASFGNSIQRCRAIPNRRCVARLW